MRSMSADSMEAPALPRRRENGGDTPPQLPRRRDTEEDAPPLPARRSELPFDISLPMPVRRKAAPPKPEKPQKHAGPAKTVVQHDANRHGQSNNADGPMSPRMRDTHRPPSVSPSRTHLALRSDRTTSSFEDSSIAPAATKPAPRFKSFLDLEQEIRTGDRKSLVENAEDTSAKPSPTGTPKKAAPPKPAKLGVAPATAKTEAKALAHSPAGIKQPESIPHNATKGPGFVSVPLTRKVQLAQTLEPVSDPSNYSVKAPGFAVMPFTKVNSSNRIPGPKPTDNVGEPASLDVLRKPKPAIGRKPGSVSSPGSQNKEGQQSGTSSGPGFIAVPFTKVTTTRSVPPKPPLKPKPETSPAASNVSPEANNEALNALLRLKPTKPTKPTKPAKPSTANPTQPSKPIHANHSNDSIASKSSISSRSSLSFNDQLSSILRTSTLPSMASDKPPKPAAPMRAATAPDTTSQAKITHKNKLRSKGPKRRLPGAINTTKSNSAGGGADSRTSLQRKTPQTPERRVPKPQTMPKKTPPPVNKASKPQLTA